MIIDSHVHAFVSASAPWRPVVQELLRHMRLVGIDRTCLMPDPQFAGTIYPGEAEMRVQAETLAAIARAYPDAFYPMLFVCPLLPYAFTLDMLERYVVNGPLVGVKFHVSLEADHERYAPICRYLQAHDIPVLFHAWYKTTDRYAFESSPAHIAAMARAYPKLRILMAHLTGAKARGMADIRHCPNVWLDTSGSEPEEGYMEQALEKLGAKRLLFGSDYPIRSFQTQLARIDSVSLTAAERELILFRNAESFFRKGKAEAGGGG